MKMLLLTFISLTIIQGVSSQIYSELPSYRGYLLNCTVCQGTKGDLCDIAAETLPHTVQCRGSCITWRTLYDNGRAMRSIYRGCEDIMFPNLLPEAAKDGCVYDNFYAQCTTLCGDGHRCNQKGTGIPHCWDCHAKFQPCEIEPAAQCTDPNITTVAPIPWKIDCVSCVGEEGSLCDLRPEKAIGTVRCNETCISWRTISVLNKTTTSVWRGCKETLYPGVLHLEALDSCDHSEIYSIQCTVQCNGALCNKYSTGISTTCWTEKAELRDQCKKHKQISINPYVNKLRESYSELNGTNSSFYGGKYVTRPIIWWRTTTAGATTSGLSNVISPVVYILIIVNLVL